MQVLVFHYFFNSSSIILMILSLSFRHGSLSSIPQPWRDRVNIEYIFKLLINHQIIINNDSIHPPTHEKIPNNEKGAN